MLKLWHMTCGGLNRVGVASLAVLSILSIMLFGAPLSNAFAENKLDVKVRIAPQISLTTSTDMVHMGVVPEPSGSFTSNGVTATVSTNSATGYSLIMSTKGSNANLVNIDDESKYISSAFDGSVTPSTMAVNTWGYSLDAINYFAIPLASNAAQINSSEEAVEGDSVLVTYGTKVTNEIIPGTYEDVVVFTAVANSDIVPPEEYTIYDITYMQDMTPLVCENTTTPNEDATQTVWNISDDPSYIPRTALIDKRDGMQYIISKHADGSCWMSQNLEFELDNEGITNEDSDLNTIESWIPNNSTYEWEDEITWAGDSWNTDRSVKAPLADKYMLDGVDPSATQPNNTTSYRWERTGIYYNWRAATAGGSHEVTQEEPNSICPKGWKLPSDEQLQYIIGRLANGANNPPDNFVYSGMVNSFGGNDRSILNIGGSDGQVTLWGGNSGHGIMISRSWGGASVQEYYKDIGLAIRCVAR